MPGFDLKQISRNDQGIVGTGGIAFVASFLPYWGWSAGGFSASTSAWTGYAILGLLLLFAAAGITALRVFGKATMPTLPIGPNLLVAALASLGALLVILRGFTYPSVHTQGGSVGVMWGGYILMLCSVAMAVFAVMNFRASGEKLAWDSSAMANAAGGSVATPGDAPQSPAAPYVPPPAASPSDESQQTPGS